MGSLSQAKTLGGIGSILLLLTFVPTAGVVLGIVGFILTLIAVKNISDAVVDASIFKNMLISVILSIVGLVVGFLVVFSAIFSLVGLRSLGTSGTVTPSAGVMAAVISILVGLVVVWIFYFISAFFLRKSYNGIASKLNVGMFRTAGLLYLIGAALTIILVGFILIFVAQILLIVAFFSIPDQRFAPAPPSYSAGVAPPPPQPMTQSSGSNFCIKCGASLAPGAIFCPSCGEKQTAL
ncbi:MAG: DUF996 domain-containing protein [Nitrososphaerales archaeon]